jgi:hypothetical protein
MTSTVFTDFQGPLVNAAWLNDVNTATYSPVNVKLAPYFAKGDGITDDTATIMAAVAAVNAAPYGAVLYFPPGQYNVTSMTWTMNSRQIRFDIGASLYGVSTIASNYILRLHNFRNCIVENITIATDGNAATPVYQSNYGCALQLTSDNGSSPTQFNTIDGLLIKYIKAGVVNGNLLGSSAQASYAQSENFIRNYRQRGVMQAFYNNATNAYITTSGCVFVTQQFESSATWWDNSLAFNLRCDTGDHVSVGDEFQAARTTGYNIYGKGMRIVAPVWEQSCGNYITGNVSISDMSNGYFGSNSTVPFTIAPASNGRLILNNIDLRRPDGTASSSRSLFVDSMNIDDYVVDINNSTIKEWCYLTNVSNAHFVLGGKFSARRLIIDNSASTQPSWELDAIEVAPHGGYDPTGASMSAVADQTAKGGWTITGAPAGATFNKYTADVPTGSTSAIQFTTVGTSMTVTTPTGTGGQPVIPGRNFIIKMMLKGIGATITNFSIIIHWYNFAGTLISSNTVYAADRTRMSDTGFLSWQELRLPARAPVDATYAAINITSGSTSNVAITSITFR